MLPRVPRHDLDALYAQAVDAGHAQGWRLGFVTGAFCAGISGGLFLMAVRWAGWAP